MAQDLTTRILRNVAAGPSDRLVEFEVPAGVLDTMAPGQFFMIGVPGAHGLLRRPFSVCDLPGTFDDAPAGAVQVLYRVYGRATSHLAPLEPGARLEVLGPLGKGLDLPEPAAPNALFVGGIGSAPFPALARALAAEDRPAARMIYGARTKADLPLLDWFRSRCAAVVVTTEDGSAGRKALVTDVLDTGRSGRRSSRSRGRSAARRRRCASGSGRPRKIMGSGQGSRRPSVSGSRTSSARTGN